MAAVWCTNGEYHECLHMWSTADPESVGSLADQAPRLAAEYRDRVARLPEADAIQASLALSRAIEAVRRDATDTSAEEALREARVILEQLPHHKDGSPD